MNDSSLISFNYYILNIVIFAKRESTESRPFRNGNYSLSVSNPFLEMSSFKSPRNVYSILVQNQVFQNLYAIYKTFATSRQCKYTLTTCKIKIVS